MIKQTLYECVNCGAQSSKWSGRCLDCGKWGTIGESQISHRQGGARYSGKIRCE
ncbi:hypothetical protein HY624_01210 [Candidatus Uhrbacteria bacterium]|nr:hypothetical protein [Candidatus Uhrbacteria bacterium]